MKTKNVLHGFVCFSILYLVILLLEKDNIAWFLKPFLLPFLIVAVYLQEQFTTKKWLLVALTLSWIGDIILLFSENGEIYFITGLIAFLLSHIFYIVLFNKQTTFFTIKNKFVFLLGAILIIIYLTTMMSVLLPSLGGLKIPVIIYALTISIMLFCGFKGFLNWQKPGNIIILIGAVLFVTSDSLLAFDKFHSPIPNSSFLIMFTYLVAQYLITLGILKVNEKGKLI